MRVHHPYQAWRRSSTGRVARQRGPPAGGLRPALRDPSRDRHRKRGPSATPPRTIGTPPMAW
eukprot:357252-Chlamydomonas_euryale.AAC.3